MRSLSIGATGMLAQQTNVEIISNNIANMNTTAYTRRRTEFQDLLYQDLRRAGSTSADNGDVVPAGIQIGLGVRTAAVYRITNQGQHPEDREHLRPGDPGQGLLLDRPAVRPDRLHPGRVFPAQRRRPDRHP